MHWSWWAVLAAMLLVMVLPVVDIKTAPAGLNVLRDFHLFVLPPSIACVAGTLLIGFALVRTDHMRASRRWWLLVVFATLQVASGVAWTAWELRVMASFD
ncbi:MAG TPA: hypothetical protein VEB22_02335 [Phycisphaerales bacterium]|nr:hypothetical protein [Phycisphaerales bacterium]